MSAYSIFLRTYLRIYAALLGNVVKGFSCNSFDLLIFFPLFFTFSGRSLSKTARASPRCWAPTARSRASLRPTRTARRRRPTCPPTARARPRRLSRPRRTWSRSRRACQSGSRRRSSGTRRPLHRCCLPTRNGVIWFCVILVSFCVEERR